MKYEEIPSSQLLEYFSYFGDDVIATHVNALIEGVPVIFYVVAANNAEIVRIWVEHGGDVEARNPLNKIPLLGFAILNAITIHEDSSSVMATLLSLGAPVSSIPKAIYSPYLQDNDKSRGVPEFDEAWCEGSVGIIFVTTVNLI